MSQVVFPNFRHNELLFQDLYFVKNKPLVVSTLKEATCVICQKGLKDGHSITAKIIGSKLRLFCQYHFPKE